MRAYYLMYKILIVDDDVDLLDMLKLFFQRKSFIAEATTKWENIYSSVSVFKPDIILLDISLKGADGRIICKELKTAEQTKNIPVLLFSADYGVKQTIPDFYADGFVEKPFEPSFLINKIELILSGNNANA